MADVYWINSIQVLVITLSFFARPLMSSMVAAMLETNWPCRSSWSCQSVPPTSMKPWESELRYIAVSLSLSVSQSVCLLSIYQSLWVYVAVFRCTTTWRMLSKPSTERTPPTWGTREALPPTSLRTMRVRRLPSCDSCDGIFTLTSDDATV